VPRGQDLSNLNVVLQFDTGPLTGKLNHRQSISRLTQRAQER